MLEIRPTFMINPSKIWFIKEPREEFESDLTNMMKERELLGRRTRQQLWHMPSEGEVVLIWCCKGKVCCRAQIQKIVCDYKNEEDSSVLAFLIDYGTSVSSSVTHVRKLLNAGIFGPGKACKLILHGIVPITKETFFDQETSSFREVDIFTKRWDLSTYDFMANILDTPTKFYVLIHPQSEGRDNDLGNKVYYGDLCVEEGNVRNSITIKLSKEKYGVLNLKKYKEFFGDSELDLHGLSMGPEKPLHARAWQIDLHKLINQQVQAPTLEVTSYSAGSSKMDPFAASPEEIELVRKATEARAEESRVEEEKARSEEEQLRADKHRSDELKLRLKPIPFDERLMFLEEEQRLRNSAKELAGVIPCLEEISSAKDVLVHYRTLYKPSSIFVTIAENTNAFKALQEEIVRFAERHPWLLGQVVLKIGAYCLAQYPGDKIWYRARITAFHPQRRAEVFFVDVGDDAHIDGYSEILPISKPLMEMLPFQAIECSLYGIQPLDEDWSEESMDAVSNYCLNENGDSVNLRTTTLCYTRAEYSDGKKFKVVLSHFNGSAGLVVSLNKTLLELPSVQLNPGEPLSD